jgi:hypothetical protein
MPDLEAAFVGRPVIFVIDGTKIQERRKIKWFLILFTSCFAGVALQRS